MIIDRLAPRPPTAESRAVRKQAWGRVPFPLGKKEARRPHGVKGRVRQTVSTINQSS